jgi:hypothetical protein
MSPAAITTGSARAAGAADRDAAASRAAQNSARRTTLTE